MSICTLIIASDKGEMMKSNKSLYLNQVLFTPMIDRAINASKGAGIDDICILRNEADAELSEYLADYKCESSFELLSDFIKGFDNVLVLMGNAPLITQTETIALTVCHDTMKSGVTVMGKKSSATYGIYCFKTQLLTQAISESCDILKAVSIIREKGEKVTELTASSDNLMLLVENKLTLHNADMLARQNAVFKAIENGADIPCTDGVIITEDCEIGVDTLILPNTIIKSGSTIGAGCVIGPNSYVENSVIGNNVKFNNGQIRDAKILDGADIGPFVQVRPNSVIGEKVHLGNFVEVKNSSIDTGTKVSHLTYVGDSDVGKNVNFGCGVVTVNYTGKSKHRTTICDNAFIGCNTNLVAPVTVGKNSYTAAGSTITDDVPDNSLGIARQRQENKNGWVIKKQPYKNKVEE